VNTGEMYFGWVLITILHNPYMKLCSLQVPKNLKREFSDTIKKEVSAVSEGYKKRVNYGYEGFSEYYKKDVFLLFTCK